MERRRNLLAYLNEGTHTWGFMGFDGFTGSIDNVTLEDMASGNKGPVTISGTSG